MKFRVLRSLLFLLVLSALLMPAGALAEAAPPQSIPGGSPDSICGTDELAGRNGAWAAWQAVAALAPEDVRSISVETAGEGGVSGFELTDAEAIAQLLTLIDGLMLEEKTDLAVLDDDLTLRVSAGADTYALRFEGNIVVLESGRYTVSGLGELRRALSKLAPEDN